MMGNSSYRNMRNTEPCLAGMFRAPLVAGDSIAHWRLSAVQQTPFNATERPMHGEMDPLFFLSMARNASPFDYPCRTEFAEIHRGKPPRPTIAFQPATWWLPLNGARVDLSGFWFRPTIVECRARTAFEVPRETSVRLRLDTCGGAVLSINGIDRATLSAYKRNVASSVIVDVTLPQGLNTVDVWFCDLCERNTHYYFQLSLLGGKGLTVAVPTAIPTSRAAALEQLVAGMRFDRSFYSEGHVAIQLPVAVSSPLNAQIAIFGDFMSTERIQQKTELTPGSDRIELGRVAHLPADFRHFRVTLADEAFSISRTLGVELCSSSISNPSIDVSARVSEALNHVAEYGEHDALNALACLALGRNDHHIDALFAQCCTAVNECHDCADFQIVPLLWCRIAFGARISPPIRASLDETILRFRYWIDEPGNDAMWYFSENHALLFHVACYLAGSLLPDAVFTRTGRHGSEQGAVGRERLLRWFENFEQSGMAEWNSVPYLPIDLCGLTALFALSADPLLRQLAGKAIARLLRLIALSSHQGMLTASQGRTYEHTLCAGRSLELSAISRLCFGRGWLGRRFHVLPQLALCIRDYGLAIDSDLPELAVFQTSDTLEWCFTQGKGGLVALYHHKSRDHAMGSVVGYRPGFPGYQETVLHLRLGSRPEAQIWINHPGEPAPFGIGRPSYWAGCATLPRVHQYRDLAIVDFCTPPEQAAFTHAWLPRREMDEVVIAGNRLAVRSGNGLAVLVGSGPFVSVEEGPTTDCEVRLFGRRTRWIVRLTDIDREQSLDRCARRFCELRTTDEADGSITLEDPDYGTVIFQPNGVAVAQSRLLDPSTWSQAGTVTRLPRV